MYVGIYVCILEEWLTQNPSYARGGSFQQSLFQLQREVVLSFPANQHYLSRDSYCLWKSTFTYFFWVVLFQ